MSSLSVGVLFVCIQIAVSQLNSQRRESTPRPGGSDAADNGKIWFKSF